MVRQLKENSRDAAMAAFLQAARGEGRLFLHSGRREARWAERSMLAEPRAWFRYWGEGRSELVDARTERALPQAERLTHRLWRDLRWLLHEPTLAGKWVGYFGYNVNAFVEPERLRRRVDERGWPIVELGWCPRIETFEATDPPATSADDAAAAVPFTQADAERLGRKRADYEAAVQRVLDYIAAGDVFQVNLAQRFSTRFEGDPRALYAALARTSPAWYGAHLDLPAVGPAAAEGAGGRALMCTSPELFLQVSGRDVVTRPIKGTRPASVDPAELAASEKDAAELHMIVDLMRNDLGRVCDYGTVKVAEPRTIESHPTVHHGVATVTGRLHESRDVVDLLRATLPGGSVTGAPKVRAMQIIDELEPHARGPYCGAIGMVSAEEVVLNVAIRTIALTADAAGRGVDREGAEARWRGVADFWAGGGIVADSTVSGEYEETLAKATAVWRALRQCG